MFYMLAVGRGNSAFWMSHRVALCRLRSCHRCRWNATEHFYSTGRGSGRTLSYYDVLETTPSATEKQIKTAYFRLSKKLHPDVNTAPDAKDRFAMLSEAYEILGNRRTRALYDSGSLGPTDVRGPTGGTADDAGTVDEEYRDFFRRRGTQFRSRPGRAPTGKTQIYDFDEFYKQHYGESMRQSADGKRIREEREKQERIMYEIARRRAMILSIGVLCMAAVLFTMGPIDR